MDILTLELFDVTVSQALGETRRALDQHPGLTLRIILGQDEMLRDNLLRFLQREGHAATAQDLGRHWQVEVTPKARAAAPPAPEVPPAALPNLLPLPLPIPEAPRPLVLLHAGYPGGEGDQGRRLLLEVLGRVAPPTPFLALAHGAMDLLEDDFARTRLEALQARGVPVRVSREGLIFRSEAAAPFEELVDAEWQSLLARGQATLL